MTFDDRLRRELQRAIPADPPPDPDALADELIRRAAGGSGPGGGGGRAALWIAGLAIVGAAIGAAIGFSGLLGAESSTTAVLTTIRVTTTAAPVTTTTMTTQAPTTTMTTATTALPATTAAPPASESTTAPTTATTAADTTPPFVGQPSVGPDPIWELDTEVISCGDKPRQSTVTVGVSDDRGVASVTLSWQFPGGPSGSKAMTGSGTYSAIVGPFPYLTVPDVTSQAAALTVTAVDGAGNTASSPASITVFSTSTCFG